jgi:primosomal replication protein N
MGLDRLSTSDNLFDFFHERVGQAVAECRVPVSRDGVYYITNLLVERSRAQEAGPKRLVDLHFEARAADHVRAVRAYRELGDEALYVSGFFRPSLERRMVGVRYYQDMGAAAYDTLSRLMMVPGVVGDLAKVFAELADGFVGCSEALAQIREGMSGQSDQDIVALYERWLSTGDQHAAARLRELGIEPAALALALGGNPDGNPC